jgi:hypothetical protein
MLSNLHERSWKVFQKFGKSQMSSVEFTATSRRALKALIEREAVRTGSRTVAHEVVAKAIGTSASWIRKFISYDGVVAEPRFAVFQNIASYYDSICTRVEQEQAKERAKLAALKVEIDAITEGFSRLVERPARTQTRRTHVAAADEGKC